MSLLQVLSNSHPSAWTPYMTFLSLVALSRIFNANQAKQFSQAVDPSSIYFVGSPVCIVTDIWLLASLGRCIGRPVPGYYCGFLYCKYYFFIINNLPGVTSTSFQAFLFFSFTGATQRRESRETLGTRLKLPYCRKMQLKSFNYFVVISKCENPPSSVFKQSNHKFLPANTNRYTVLAGNDYNSRQ